MTTERLRMDALTMEHIELLVALDADVEVMRYINGGQPTSRTEVAATIRASLGHRWAAFTRSGGEFVGWFGMRPTSAAEYELGYRLRRPFWGLGLAVEGSGALLRWAFSEQSARRVWAQTMTVNARSRRVMEACGFRYVRTFHLQWDEPIEGTEFGDVEYELVRSDYIRRAERCALVSAVRQRAENRAERAISGASRLVLALSRHVLAMSTSGRERWRNGAMMELAVQRPAIRRSAP